MNISRKHRWAALAAVGAIAALALSACSPADSIPQATQSGSASNGVVGPSTMTDVTMQIEGSAVPYYAPLYEAIEQGYFAKHNLNVNLLYAEGATVIQNVAAGNVQFGFPNAPGVIAAQANGVKTKVVHTTYQKGIGAVLFNAETSGIKTAKDLKGKTIAVTDLGSPQTIALKLLLQDAGLKMTDVNIKIVGVGAIIQALQKGEVDAISFNSVRYYALKNAGFPAGEILTEPALPTNGNVVITSPDYLKSNPQVVAGFIAALDEGIKYVIADPAGSVSTSIAKYATTFAGQETAITEVINEIYIKQLWNSKDTDKYGFGYGDLPRWQTSIDALADAKLIDRSFKASELVVEPKDIH